MNRNLKHINISAVKRMKVHINFRFMTSTLRILEKEVHHCHHHPDHQVAGGHLMMGQEQDSQQMKQHHDLLRGSQNKLRFFGIY